MNIEAFIIHLKRAEQRRPQVDRIMEACPVKTSIIDAVDGRAMSPNQRAQVYTTDKLFEPRYPFEIGAGEIGCFLSHRRAWQAIIDGNLHAGLIIEDDVEIDREVFSAALNAAEKLISDRGIVQFQVREIEQPGPIIATEETVNFHQPVIVPLRLSCTLFSADAASLLLQLSSRFDRPVDGMMQLHWATGLRPVIVVPSGVADTSIEVGGTTIQSKDLNLLPRLRRELLRPFYRWQIQRLSHKSDNLTEAA